MNERCRTKLAVEITGLELRHLQAMANRGAIPGAAKMGRIWTFDVRKLRRWVRGREEEAEKCHPISTGVGTSGGGESRFEGTTLDEAYEQALS